MHRKWLVNRTNPEFLTYIARQASISPILAQLLVNRDIKDPDAIKAFLAPSLESLHDPMLLHDMDRAVQRLETAVENNEKVLVHGDYDADGITSTALLVSVLRRAGLDVFYHIPHRINEGYGVSLKGIEKARSHNVKLIITADCGISSRDEIQSARSMGMDVIVTDHHMPPEELPEAWAIINPHRKDSTYPYKNLAGVGVAFKLAQALAVSSKINLSDAEVLDMLDLVALGSIADSVPLTGENRVLVTYGLKVINRASSRTGTDALKEVAGLKDEIRSGNLAFTVIPRINAAGRLGDASDVVELFLTEDRNKAAELTRGLDDLNRQRQKIQGDVFNDAEAMIERDGLDSVIVLWSHEWHPGVVGIVASRLLDIHNRPVFLFSVKGSVAKGSARSIDGFQLYDAIAECSDHLMAFGGHSQAAGLKLSTDNLQLFRESINAIARSRLKDDDMKPVLEIDAAVSFSELNFRLIEELGLLEPFGEGNREPLLGAKEAEIVNHRIVGTNHLKMLLKQNRVNVDSIGFSMGDVLEKLNGHSSMDIAFVPSINEWNGNRTLQLNLKAVRPSG